MAPLKVFIRNSTVLSTNSKHFQDIPYGAVEALNSERQKMYRSSKSNTMQRFLNKSNIWGLEIHLSDFCIVRVHLFDGREVGIINPCGHATRADRYKKTIPRGRAEPDELGPLPASWKLV